MTASASPAAGDTWVYDHAASVYFHPGSNTYAVPDSVTGQWRYIPASEFHGHGAESSAQALGRSHGSQATSQNPSREAGDAVGNGEKEEGEIEDDVGWGGLMEPEQLQAVLKTKPSIPGSMTFPTKPISTTLEKHPAYTAYSANSANSANSYDDPNLYAYPSSTPLASEQPPDPSTSTPAHILRLVVQSSKVLIPGQVIIIDARQGGIQLGRDRCERGAQARVRLREMEVSKTHAVVYYGDSGDTDFRGHDEAEESAWWIVDLGSTHGTFLSPPTQSQSDAKKKDKKDRTRLSEPKHSSQPCRISHLAQIVVGSTTLIAHIHPSWPCDTCQLSGTNEIVLDDGEKKLTSVSAGIAPDVVGSSTIDSNGNGAWNVAMTSQQKRDNREINRKREMKLLRHTLLNRDNPPASASTSASASAAVRAGTGSDNDTSSREYLDRSAMRRRLHPPSPHTPRNAGAAPAQTQPVTITAPVIVAVQPDRPAATTFAASFMANQGWQAGQGLGRDGTGRAEPIATELRTAKRGLGAEGSKAVVDSGEGDWRQRGKRRRWDELAKGQ